MYAVLTVWSWRLLLSYSPTPSAKSVPLYYQVDLVHKYKLGVFESHHSMSCWCSHYRQQCYNPEVSLLYDRNMEHLSIGFGYDFDEDETEQSAQ